MEKYSLMAMFIFSIAPRYGQSNYPDSARVIGLTHFWAATGEMSGNRVSVRDSQGWIHAVFAYDWGLPFADSAEIYYVYSTDNGLTWSVPENVSRTDSFTAVEPDLAIDSNDCLHCVWRQCYDDTTTPIWDYDLYYSQNNGTGWSVPLNVSNQGHGDDGCYSSMVVDSRDNVYVVYDMSTGPGNWDVFCIVYTDTGWSLPYQLSTSPGDDAFPSMAIDHNDNLHVVWRERSADGPIVYTRYDGVSWTQPEVIADLVGGATGHPCIVVNSQGYPRVCYNGAIPTESSEIFYTEFDGVSWSAPLNLSNTINPSSYLSMAIDSLDNLYVVWREELPSPQKSELYYRTYNGAFWSTISNITQDTVGSYCPKLGNPIKGNKIDLLWASWFGYPPPTLEVVYLGLDRVTAVDEEEGQAVAQPMITAHPNPFSQMTEITFASGHSAEDVELHIYDAVGKVVKRISCGTPYLQGVNHITWQGDDQRGHEVPAGVYFIQVKGGNYIKVEKIIKVQ